MPNPQIRAGDIVCHTPSDDEWLVALADYESGDLFWCDLPHRIARPAGVARIADWDVVDPARAVELREELEDA